jgi:nephrocystin-3
MGCGAVKLPKNPYEVEQEQIWAQALASANTVKRNKNVVVKRSGWKTIRIFVSSTFRDFHQEREILVKKVIVLRLNCQSF